MARFRFVTSERSSRHRPPTGAVMTLLRSLRRRVFCLSFRIRIFEDGYRIERWDDIGRNEAAMGSSCMIENERETLHLLADIALLHGDFCAIVQDETNFPVFRAEDFDDGGNLLRGIIICRCHDAGNGAHTLRGKLHPLMQLCGIFRTQVPRGHAEKL